MTSTPANGDHGEAARERAAYELIKQCLAVDRWVNVYPIIHDNFVLFDEYGDVAVDAFERTTNSEEFARNFPAAEISKYRNDIDNLRRIIKSCWDNGLSRTFVTVELQTPDPTIEQIKDLLQRANAEFELPPGIRHLRTALQLAADRSVPLQAFLRVHLARALANEVTGDAERNREEALEHFQWALDTYIRDADWQDWAIAHGAIAQLYEMRTTGDRAENLDYVIRHLSSAMQYYARAKPPTMYARMAVKLAGHCAQRMQGDPRENLSRAIEWCEGALQAVPRDDDPETWGLAHAQLTEYYLRAGRARSHLQDIASHASAACEVLTEEANPATWGRVQEYSGRACLENYYYGPRDAQDLEAAIERLNAALRVVTRTNDQDRWVTIHMLLGEAYRDRVAGDLIDNVERAVACLEAALELRSKEASPHEWAMIHSALGTCFVRRVAGDDKKNRARAVKHYENALEVINRTQFPHLWAMVQSNLGTAYWDPMDPARSEYEERAIAHSELALEVLTKDQHPYDWAATHTNLANYYLNSATGEQADNIARAVDHARAALDVRTREACPSDWAQVQALLGAAVSAAGAEATQAGIAASHYQSALEVYRPDTYPDACCRVATALGHLAFKHQQWDRAAAAYLTGAAAVRTLHASALFRRTRRFQQGQLVLHHYAAYALARLGRVREAVVMLESGRAIEVRTVLQAHGERLRAVADRDAVELLQRAVDIDRALDAADRFIGLPKAAHLTGQEEAAAMAQLTERALQTMPSTFIVIDDKAPLDEHLAIFTRMRRKREAEVREARETAARLRRQAIERLRRIPGLERFGGDPDFEEIAEAVSSECPLVFMAATDRGSLALIVRREESAEPAVEPLWLDDFSWRTARELADEWRRSQGHAADMGRTLDRTLIALGSVMTPIVSRLVDLGASRAVLLPAGYLALLPLHAARTGGNGQAHYLLDSLEVTYAPSARAVAILRSEARRRKARDRSFCAIGNPRPADMPLPFAHEEVSGASRLFDPDSVTLLFEASASIGPVLEAAAKATHVHFACHCVVDWTEPLHSRLELAGDSPLLLRDVIYQHAGAWNVASLVVVSACQSGAPDVARPDEAIGWPSAFLLAGVPNVIAAQWPVDDVSTALLMPRFYELLLGANGETAVDPVAALLQAQRWLRTVTLGELRERARRSGLSEDAVAEIAARVGGDDPACQPFLNSPFDWAAFSAHGI